MLWRWTIMIIIILSLLAPALRRFQPPRVAKPPTGRGGWTREEFSLFHFASYIARAFFLRVYLYLIIYIHIRTLLLLLHLIATRPNLIMRTALSGLINSRRFLWVGGGFKRNALRIIWLKRNDNNNKDRPAARPIRGVCTWHRPWNR